MGAAEGVFWADDLTALTRQFQADWLKGAFLGRAKNAVSLGTKSRLRDMC